MTLAQTLTQVFNANFVAYYRSHVAHVNIMGRNFYSDHKLLQKIYEHLQGNIDTIAEFIRTLDEFMPESLEIVGDGSVISDEEDVFGNSEELLGLVLSDLNTLVTMYRELEVAAEDEDEDQIANFAQDQETALTKFIWMIKSTLD